PFPFLILLSLFPSLLLPQAIPPNSRFRFLSPSDYIRAMEEKTTNITIDSIKDGTTPYGSGPASTAGSPKLAGVGPGTAARFFHSRRIKPGEALPQPWKEMKDPREKWVTIIPCIGLFAG